MLDHKSYFKNKKITVMGLGLLGRGVGDAAFLAECGAKLLVTDLKNKEQLKESLKKLKKYKNPSKSRAGIKFVLGKHRLEDFKNKDFILKAAGVPLDSPYIKEARKNKIPVEMSSSLFAKLAGIPIIGVTGTRGKSTVAYLINHILKSAGKNILLGGNILGVSTLSFLPGANRYDYAVLELDSWQLQGFGDNKISPDIAVFTTFLPDHMSYYKNNMEKYFADKANIFKYQNARRASIDGARHDSVESDLLIAGKQAYPFIKKRGGKIKGKLFVPRESLPKGWKINLPGKHNEYNASLAIEVARSLWIPDAVIKKAFTTFSPVPGRLELIREIRGVKIYNDTNATTEDATIAALHALGGEASKLKKNIILIAGGSDKGLNMTKLVREIPKYCREVVLLRGSGTEQLVKNYELRVKSHEAGSMKEAVVTAMKLAKKGDIVVLSPAFASFGMFKNEYDRGGQFNKIVSRL